MNEKERLINSLNNKKVDRAPVICPGGMMNSAVTGLLGDIKKNHNSNADDMVEVAKRINSEIGFENFGVPFCMTVECEPFGIELDMGNKLVEPRVTEYNKRPLDEIQRLYRIRVSESGRMPVVLEAINRLKNDEVPVIGNITGPISTATSIVDPLKIFRQVRTEPEKLEEFFEFVNDYQIEYAIEMVKAGADVIAVSDPTATGEILGKKNFDKFVVPLYKKFIKVMHDIDTPVIVHICGNAKTILESLNDIDADALSFDSIVNMKYAKSKVKTNLMGNVNTQLLDTGEKDKIKSITEHAIKSGVDIVSPACGLSMSTPIENLRTMTNFVKEGHLNG